MKSLLLLFSIFNGCIQTLQAKPPTDPKPLSWNITQTNGPSLLTDNDGNPVMVLQYLMSNREYDVKVFKNDCANSSSVPVLFYEDSFSNMMGFIDVDVNITIKQADIEASDIWNSTSDLDGSFSFCLSSSLYLTDNKTEENIISQYNAIFNVDVDKRSGFDISGIEIEADGPDVNDDFVVDFEGNVTAYRCDPTTLEPLTVLPPLGPFDVLDICVEETSNENITIDSIIDLTLEQNETYTTFVAIEDGAVKPGYEDVVETSCSGGKCLARIVLINAFFSSGVAYPIDVSGTVLLAFGRRRRLLGLHSYEAGVNEERRLMGNSADFELIINFEQKEGCEEESGLLASLVSLNPFA